MIYTEQGRVLENEEMAGGQLRRLKVWAPQVVREARAGQFVHIRPADRLDPLLRRPMSIHRKNCSRGELEIAYEVVGSGTRLLAGKRAGDSLDIMGPLGNGFSLPEGRLCVIVGGGIGCAPLLFLAEVLKERDNEVQALLGGRTCAHLPALPLFREVCDQVRVTTEDGSEGRQGYVTAVLPDPEECPGDARLYACGPEPMLERVAEYAGRCSVPCEVSLERRMGCGLGACLSCVCSTSTGDSAQSSYSLVCRQGPVFTAEEVDWSG